MTLENVIETDVLVVGGGMAGMFAAIKARERGFDITLVDKGYVSQSGGAAFAGGYYNVFNPEWGHDLDAWVEQVSKTGEYVNNREWTEIVLKDSYDRYQDLISWGVEFVKEKDGKLYFKRRGVLKTMMMWRGKYMPVVRKQTLKVGVNIMNKIMVVDLLKQDGKVVGAIGFHTTSGDLYIFKAKATVITTGNNSFKTGPAPIHYWTSDGDAMGYRAGLEITGKEFSFRGNTGMMADYPDWRGHGFANIRFGKLITAEGKKVKDPTIDEVHAGRAPILLGPRRCYSRRYKVNAAASEGNRSSL